MFRELPLSVYLERAASGQPTPGGGSVSAVVAALAVAWAIGLLVPPDFRVHYWNSIRSSYTAGELEDLVAQSRLAGARVEQSLLDVMIVKEG